MASPAGCFSHPLIASCQSLRTLCAFDRLSAILASRRSSRKCALHALRLLLQQDACDMVRLSKVSDNFTANDATTNANSFALTQMETPPRSAAHKAHMSEIWSKGALAYQDSVHEVLALLKILLNHALRQSKGPNILKRKLELICRALQSSGR